MANTKRLGALLTVAAAALVAVGLVVLMLVVVEARPAEASFPGKNGKIAHAADDGGIYRIYTINPKGGATFRVTHTNTFTATLDYSPNGKRIAYSNIGRRNKAGVSWEIFTINATGGKPFQVTHDNTNNFAPSYSPSDKKIAYEHGGGLSGTDSEIYTINATGGNPFRLTNNNTSDRDPSYSSDGRKIAFSSFDGNHSVIYTINPGGGGKKKVTQGSSPSWSPNGKKIAYEQSPLKDVLRNVLVRQPEVVWDQLLGGVPERERGLRKAKHLPRASLRSGCPKRPVQRRAATQANVLKG